MSSDNEFSNGAGGRFNSLMDNYLAGGDPRSTLKVSDLIEAAEMLSAAVGGLDDEPFMTELDDDGLLERDISIVALIHEFNSIKMLKDACDLLDKEITRIYDFLRLVVIPERFEQEGISNMKLGGIGRVQLASDIYSSIRPNKKEEAYQWLDDIGKGSLIKSTVNSESLKVVLKAMLKGGEEIPEDLFKVEPFTRASIVRAPSA